MREVFSLLHHDHDRSGGGRCDRDTGSEDGAILRGADKGGDGRHLLKREVPAKSWGGTDIRKVLPIYVGWWSRPRLLSAGGGEAQTLQGGEEDCHIQHARTNRKTDLQIVEGEVPRLPHYLEGWLN